MSDEELPPAYYEFKKDYYGSAQIVFIVIAGFLLFISFLSWMGWL